MKFAPGDKGFDWLYIKGSDKMSYAVNKRYLLKISGNQYCLNNVFEPIGKILTNFPIGKAMKDEFFFWQNKIEGSEKIKLSSTFKRIGKNLISHGKSTYVVNEFKKDGDVPFLEITLVGTQSEKKPVKINLYGCTECLDILETKLAEEEPVEEMDEKPTTEPTIQPKKKKSKKFKLFRANSEKAKVTTVIQKNPPKKEGLFNQGLGKSIKPESRTLMDVSLKPKKTKSKKGKYIEDEQGLIANENGHDNQWTDTSLED
jgi:hypothetical protein